MKLISLWSVDSDDFTPTLGQMMSAIQSAVDAGVHIDARPNVWWNDDMPRYEWAFEVHEDVTKLSNFELTGRLSRAIAPAMSGEPEEIWLEIKRRLENS